LRDYLRDYCAMEAEIVEKLAPIDSQLFLTAGEVAELLRVSRSQVYVMVRRRELPSILIHNSVRIPSSALRKWIEQHTVGEVDGSQR
jgi:excisionase family DNA binding protein